MADIYLKRRERLRKQLKKNNLENILITNFTNVTYLTGFSGDDSYLLVGKKRDILLSDPRYEIQISEECPHLDAAIRAPKETMSTLLKEQVPKMVENGSLGVEADSLSIAEFKYFKELLDGKIELVPVSALVEQLREIKDAEEISAIRRSLRCAYRAFEIVRNGLRARQTEIDVRNDLEYNMFRLGAQAFGFPSIVAVGRRAALPHAIPTEQMIGEGNLLLIDWGAKLDLYISDLTRVLITTPRPSKKLRDIYDVVLRANRAAIDKVRPGVVCGEIDAAARKVIEDAGFGNAFNHGLGHGIGLVVHDRGRFASGSQVILKPGMVMTIEPGIYLEDWGGIRIEDDILVTEDGCEILSQYVPREFEEMMVDI